MLRRRPALATWVLMHACIILAPPLHALTARSFAPANGSVGVCADTPLSITFDATPKLGSRGTVRITRADGTPADTLDLALNAPNGTQPRTIGGANYNTYPVILSGNTATIFPHAGTLANNTTYHVTVDAGVFDGYTGGNTAWTFTTRTSAPDPKKTNLMVAADGRGDFSTVQGAVDFIPADNATPRLILIRSGTYQEIVNVPRKNNITFRGQDRQRTIIAYPNNSNLNHSTMTRALCNVSANDVSFDNLTLANTTPSGGSQAEALRVYGSRCLVNRCILHSYQDTFLVNSTPDTAYLYDSLVEGSVDFIWAAGSAVFRNCEIKSIGRGYICQMRNQAGQYGAVFLDCRLTCAPGVSKVYLARIDPANYPDSAVEFVNCAMDSHIKPDGWLLNNTKDAPKVRFWEYQSTDLTGGRLPVTGRAPFSTQIDPTTAAALRNPPPVLGGWTPPPPKQPAP